MNRAFLIVCVALALTPVGILAGCEKSPPAPASAGVPKVVGGDAPPPADDRSSKPGAAAAPDKQHSTLRVYMWSEYIDPEIPKQFEKATGISMKIDVYEDTETMLAKLQHQEGDKLYDLAIVSDHAVALLAKLKLIRELDKPKVANLQNVSARFRMPPYDPAGAYSAPYQWGTVGLIYRKDRAPAGELSWKLVLDPATPSPFVLIDSMRDMLGVALKFRGRSVNETDPEAVALAGKAILSAKRNPACLGFEGGVGGKNKVAGGMASYAIVYSGDALRAAADDPNLAYGIPQEGSIIWVDAMVVTARGANPEGAHAFINYILDPVVGARLSNWTRYATPCEAALDGVRKEDRDNAAIYPAQDMLAKLEYITELGEATRKYDEVWTAVKAR